MPIEIIELYTHGLIDGSPEKLFVFGDNDLRKGIGGQAKVCRGKPNCLGVRTKKAPLTGDHVYYSDADYKENCAKISEDFNAVWRALDAGKTVCFPASGIGTGFAQLQMRAPRTMAFITEMLALTLKEFA